MVENKESLLKKTEFYYSNTLYRASFIVFYYDQQMHNYFTNYCDHLWNNCV